MKKRQKLPEKIIFSSTISVYGEKLNQNIYNEDTEKTPRTPYSITKLEAEKYLIKYFPDRSWILRFSPVYSTDFRVNINRRVLISGFFYKVGNGSQKLSLCNIENILKVVRSIINEQIPADVYNISDNKEYSYNYLLKNENAKKIIVFPRIFIYLIFYFSKIMKNHSLQENSVKLLSNNIFPSTKIRKFIEIPKLFINDKKS